jgi:methylmalonyl-CoA mutase N-terminal domain/subunit
VIDPLGGSYFVEALTDRMEEHAEELLARIEGFGEGSMLEGVLAGIERGWFQGEIAEAAYREQARYESGDLIKVGVNRFVEDGGDLVDTLVIGPQTEAAQVRRVAETRASRSAAVAERALRRLEEVARGDANLMPALIDCARGRCTEGEIVGVLRSVFGGYTEVPRF